MSPRFALLVVVGMFAATCVGRANAAPISATLAIQYFEVGVTASRPDFGGAGTPNVANGSTLGPNGLPVASAPFGVSDVDPTTHEITWWSPALNSQIVPTGTGTVTLPFASNMFAPNSTGTNDATFFETSILTGAFSLSSPSAVEFQLGSDDDSFIYVDGTLFGQNPGIHGVTNVDFTTPTLAAGSHTIEVFYDDREQVVAFLSLDLLTSGVVITPTDVPEPSSLALLGLGILGCVVIQKRTRGLIRKLQ